MESGRGVEVLDPYEWLPGPGEDSVTISTHGTDLSAIVEYECADGTTNKKEIFFAGVSAFAASAFPGPKMPGLTYSIRTGELIGSLIQFPESEAAFAWTEHFGDGRVFKHFSIAFLSENIQLVVFALKCELRDVH